MNRPPVQLAASSHAAWGLMWGSTKWVGGGRRQCLASLSTICLWGKTCSTFKARGKGEESPWEIRLKAEAVSSPA